MKKYFIICVFLTCGNMHAKTVDRIGGEIGETNNYRPTLTVKEGSHKGTFIISPDIKGVGFYQGAHIIAYDADLTDSTITFDRFDWGSLKDFMLSKADFLPGWSLSKIASERDIPASLKLPSLVNPPPVPERGIAQRLIVRGDQVEHAFQIRYYEFRSPSEAAMFAERWSSFKGVKRDTSEHFRRAFERYAVWVVNADDERQPPDYWTARFIIEALSRKSLITMDTSVIFSIKNTDPMLFEAKHDTVAPGDTVAIIGQGFSPILQDNILYVVQDSLRLHIPTLSATSREITTEIPWSYLDSQETIKPIHIMVQIRHYYHSNTMDFYVRRKK